MNTTQTSTCGCSRTACYPVKLRQYPATILLKAGLSQYANLFWELRLGEHYWVGPLFTNSAGTSTINIQTLDKYSFSQYKGPFRLRIVNSMKMTQPMVLGGTQYWYVTIQFVDISDLAGNLHNLIA